MLNTSDSFSDCTDDVLEASLKRYFGYNTFRDYQKEIIHALLRGEDVLAILPTGAGKSLCYQLPALIKGGTAIVISPLISLMQDQVISLYKNGISAAFINSSLPYHEIQTVLHNMADYKLLYVAPERLVDPQFIDLLKGISLSFFVIDEAHCISQWGHSFRIEYRRLSLLKGAFPDKPIIALTATATPDVEKDIQNQLVMKCSTVIKGSFDRPNLTISVNPKNQIEKQLKAFIARQGDRPGIIYASTRKGVESTYEMLKEEGYSVGRYHAGMAEKERSASQHAFLHDQVNLMVATVAFGMGVHKPDIRYIIHIDMPRTIEQYYQEIGRAGRDGLPAECLMLFSTQDAVVYKNYLGDLDEEEVRNQMKVKIDQMYRFCTSWKCRRKGLLSYFGEFSSKTSCNACDNCMEEAGQEDGTVTAQKILSCVYRLNQNVGIRMVTDVLRGSKGQHVLSRGYDKLSTYGLLKDLCESEVRYSIDSLLHLNFLRLTEGEYPVLKWTDQTPAVIKGKQQVFFKKRVFEKKKPEKESVTIEKRPLTLEYHEELFEILRALRLEVAREEGVPPYVVFSDRALQEMAVYFPADEKEFIQINGVGPIKWVKYGEKFLDKIRPFRPEKVVPQRVEKEVIAAQPKKNSSEETLALYQEGRSLEEIMEIRRLVKGTIISHLIDVIEQGIHLDLTPLVSNEKQAVIQEAIEEVGDERLTPIKEKVPQTISFDDIKLVLAIQRQKNARS